MKRTNRNIILSVPFLFIMFLGSLLFAEQRGSQKNLHQEIVKKTHLLTIPFIQNKGQTDERVKFYASTFGATVYITDEGEIVYSLPYIMDNSKKKSWKNIEQPASFPVESATAMGVVTSNESIPGVKRIVLKEQLLGGKTVTIKGEKPSTARINYYKGKKPLQFQKDIPTYESITFGEVFHGVELILKAYGNNVEKLFYVKPDIDPDSIKLRIEGADALSINEKGQLEADTALGKVTFTKPVAYQDINGKRINVAASYVLKESGMIYGFKAENYDKSKELVIDPLLASTYLGGSDNDDVCSLLIDKEGYIYVAGTTSPSDFPTTSGSFDNGGEGGDAFISKINATLTGLIASTFLGGSSEDSVRSFVLDSEGNVYVMGDTTSSDFPTTENAYTESLNDSYGNVFISKFDTTLTELLASTYLGGSYGDHGSDIAIDSDGNIYITGDTNSSDFPTSASAYKNSLKDSSGDVFVSKLDNELTSLLASTFLGGSSGDYGSAVDINSEGNVFVAGTTMSSDFPSSSDAYDTSFNGGEYDIDGFVAKFDKNLTSLVASTYIGGYFNDSINALAKDSEGNIYVTGRTASSNFPTTTEAYDTTYNFGSDAFIVKLSNDLKSLVSSTFLGGSGYPSEGYEYNYGYEQANAIIIDSGGNIYVTGSTYSSDFPTTIGAYNASFNGGNADAFISKLDKDLEDVLDSTYFGGTSGDDCGKALAVGTEGDIYIAGITNSSDFPVTDGILYKTYNGRTDTFISQLDSDLSALLGKISGRLLDKDKNPVKSAKIYLKGKTTKIKRKTFSDENGLFEFGNLDADTYKITAKKNGYKESKTEVELEEGEETEVNIEMKKQKS
ncbi:MAG: hypothetical protein FJ264_03995 [Planctomycetes bacterium]|nr:hypothetical protein [Planctomycetota bacterium]